jgi:hypothetical protein
MAVFFSRVGYRYTGEWKEEIVFFDPSRNPAQPAVALFPEGTRAHLAPDRDPRDTGLESERNNRPSAAQRLHLLNSSHVQRKIAQSPKLRVLVSDLYLLILSRYPTPEELKIVAAKGRDAVNDLAWALIDTAEFLYRH